MNAAALMEDEATLASLRAPAASAVYRADRFARNNALREYYRAALKAIEQKPAHVWALDPYEIDWLAFFTPIEAATWGDIRYVGAVFYPQFPVGRYFVDFGNPVAKIAIECDGKIHLQQRDADAERQAEIEAQGWRVFRLTGAQCMQEAVETEDDYSGKVSIELGAGERLIQRLAREYSLSGRWAKEAA